jgi:hypothetical protein
MAGTILGSLALFALLSLVAYAWVLFHNRGDGR